MQLTFPSRGKRFDEALSDMASTAANLRPIVIMIRYLIGEECSRGQEIVHPRAENEFVVQPTKNRWLCVIKLPYRPLVQCAREWWPETLVPTAQNREFPLASHLSLLPTKKGVLSGDCPEYWKRSAHPCCCLAPCRRAHSGSKQAIRGWV